MGRTGFFATFAACMLAVVMATPTAARNGGWQCVTYARSITEFSIRGNANTWWNQAEGRYERGKAPVAGAILAFKANAASRRGHVAVVRQVINDRELIIDHANWTVRGGVERNARVVDVSETGDWSAVKVSYGGGMGTRVNPIYGFIYPKNGPRDFAEPTVQFASQTKAPLELTSDIRALATAESAL